MKSVSELTTATEIYNRLHFLKTGLRLNKKIRHMATPEERKEFFFGLSDIGKFSVVITLGPKFEYIRKQLEFPEGGEQLLEQQALNEWNKL